MTGLGAYVTRRYNEDKAQMGLECIDCCQSFSKQPERAGHDTEHSCQNRLLLSRCFKSKLLTNECMLIAQYCINAGS